MILINRLYGNRAKLTAWCKRQYFEAWFTLVLLGHSGRAQREKDSEYGSFVFLVVLQGPKDRKDLNQKNKILNQIDKIR